MIIITVNILLCNTGLEKAWLVSRDLKILFYLYFFARPSIIIEVFKLKRKGQLLCQPPMSLGSVHHDCNYQISKQSIHQAKTNLADWQTDTAILRAINVPSNYGGALRWKMRTWLLPHSNYIITLSMLSICIFQDSCVSIIQWQYIDAAA